MKHVKLFEQFLLETKGVHHQYVNEASDKDEEFKGIIRKIISTGPSGQSARWAQHLQYAPEDKQKYFESLKRRDDQYNEKELAKIEKLISKGESMKDKMSSELLDLFSFVTSSEWMDANLNFKMSSGAYQGAEQACKDYKKGCDEVKKLKDEFDKSLKIYFNAKDKLDELRKKANVRA